MVDIDAMFDNILQAGDTPSPNSRKLFKRGLAEGSTTVQTEETSGCGRERAAKAVGEAAPEVLGLIKT